MLVSQSCRVWKGAQVLCKRALSCPQGGRRQKRPLQLISTLTAVRTDFQALGPGGTLLPPLQGHEMDGFGLAHNTKEREARR